MAPEHLQGRLCKASDVYSLGVIIWEMAHGRQPYHDMSRADIVAAVLTGARPLVWDAHLPAELVSLGMQCMRRSAASRPTCREVIGQLVAIETRLREKVREERLSRRCSPDPRALAGAAAWAQRLHG